MSKQSKNNLKRTENLRQHWENHINVMFSMVPFLQIAFKFRINMAISILFFVRKRSRANFFELFAKVFRRFRPRGNFFDGPKIFQILADSAAIRLVQKSSKSEPSSRFFSHLNFEKFARLRFT